MFFFMLRFTTSVSHSAENVTHSKTTVALREYLYPHCAKTWDVRYRATSHKVLLFDNYITDFSYSLSSSVSGEYPVIKSRYMHHPDNRGM